MSKYTPNLFGVLWVFIAYTTVKAPSREGWSGKKNFYNDTDARASSLES